MGMSSDNTNHQHEDEVEPTINPTTEDVQWMTDRAAELARDRLAKLGKGAKLCDQEVSAICIQAAKEGEQRARDLLVQQKSKVDEELRKQGKPTLKVSLGDLINKRRSQ